MTCIACGRPRYMDHFYLCPNWDPCTAREPLTDEQQRERAEALHHRTLTAGDVLPGLPASIADKPLTYSAERHPDGSTTHTFKTEPDPDAPKFTYSVDGGDVWDRNR